MAKDNKRAKREKEQEKEDKKQEAGGQKQEDKKKSEDSAKSSGKGEEPKKKPEPKPEPKEEKKLPAFRVGDTVKVFWRIREEGKERVQPFEGIAIAMKGSGVSRTFTVRKLASQGIGVERIFPLHSPNIQRIRIVKKGRVRRAKLYYLRKKVGKKATRIKARSSEK